MIKRIYTGGRFTATILLCLVTALSLAACAGASQSKASGSDTKELREEFGDEKNLVVTGHIASDAVGMNEFVDALEEEGLDCTRFSGLSLGQ